MQQLALFLALCLMPLSFPIIASAQSNISDCATSAAKFTDAPTLTLPQDAKPTSTYVAFEVDIGSDGRVRGLQMDHGSGDKAIDLDVRQTLQAAAYSPPQSGCVSSSGAFYISYSLGTASVAVAPQEIAQNSTCTPFIIAFLTPLPRDRKKTGSAVIVVDLDASGARSGNAVLRKSTGSPVLDAEALRIAAAGHYNFVRQSACTPQAFSYSLELTFQ